MPGTLGLLDPAPGLVWAWAVKGELCEQADPVELADWLANPASVADGAWVWLHFDLSDRRAPATLARLVGRERPGGAVPAPLLDSFLRPGDMAELHFTQGLVHGSLRDRVIDIDGASSDEHGLLHIVVSPTVLLTGRRLHLQSVESARELARSAGLGAHPMRLLESFARLGTVEHERRLDELSSALDRIEDQLLTEAGAIERGRILRMRHALVRLHRELAALLRLHGRVDQEVREETGRLAPALPGGAAPGVDHWADFGSLLQHLHALDELCLSLGERARLLQEEASDQLTAQTNRQLYVLSILTAALGPPTIVVGVFGMNTGGLPLTGEPLGTGIALALCLLSSLLVIGVLALTGLIASPDRAARAEPRDERLRPADGTPAAPERRDGRWLPASMQPGRERRPS
ncbi:CorA family divalent cation transporter [Derxia lacustris]|uniref:CorA family divalent cation transporter n=1 Tax=Derxia lacustris TaxID=764842 RepID=UPI0015938580|nr:CorA family divalent cation transporter [Derxia lacustris]